MKRIKKLIVSLILSLVASSCFVSAAVLNERNSAKIYAEVTNQSYISSHEDFNDVIDEKTYRGAQECSVAKPDGFDKVWKYNQTYTNVSSTSYLYAHGANFSDKPLNAAAKIRFAMKTNHKMNFNFKKFDESHDWLIFTLTQVKKAKWSLVVEDLNGTEVYNSASDSNTRGGLLDGSYETNGVYVDNALNSILFGNCKGFGAQAPLNSELYTYVTEIRAVMKPHSVAGKIIDDALYNSRNIELSPSEENPPAGYSKVWNYTAAAGVQLIRGDTYSETVLDNMSVVNFALKTTGDFVIDDRKGGVYSGNDWLFFSLTQTEKSVWTVLIQDSDYDTVYTKSGLSGIKNTSYYVDNSLQTILFGVSGFYPLGSANESVTVSVTEVRATLRHGTTAFETEVIEDSFIRTAREIEDDYLAPEGFESVYKIKYNASYLHGGLHYSNYTLTDYEEVYFAVRNDKYFRFGKSGILAQRGWIYFTLTNRGNGNWQITVKDRYGTLIHRYDDVDGNAINSNYTQDGISTILYGGTYMYYPYYSAFGNFYFTEVRGIRKKNLTHNLLDYQMICPDASVAGSGRAVRAANEYRTFVSEAIGANIYWYRESAVSDKNKKFISIGNTSLLRNAGFGISDSELSELGDSGYIIKTDAADNIYVIGGNEQDGWMGLMSGVYDLLHDYFGYEYYADGVYSLNRGVTEVLFDVADMNKKVIPSFKYRKRSYGFNSANSVDKEFNGYRLRMNDMIVFSFAPNGADMHNLEYAIPYSEYGASHGEWYTSGGAQFCFGRDPDGIAKTAVDKMLPIITAAENKNSELKSLNKYFYVGMTDSTVWCDCSACTKYINLHGGYKVSTYINLINKIAALLKKQNRTDIKPVMLAYHSTQDAPVKENFDGSYSPVNADMKLDDNVAVYYCPIEANYYVPLDYAGNAARNDGTPSVKDRNASALKSLKGWSAVAKNVMYYFYMEHFPYHYMEFYDIFGSIQDNFRFAAENGGISMYNLGQFNESVSSGFARLKEYVNAKLMWNVNENVDELIDGFFKNYYGVAGGQMRKIFDEYRAMVAEKFKTHPEYGDMSIYSQRNLSSDWFDKTKLAQWLDDIKSAYAAVENARAAGTITETEKLRLNKAIKTESMFLRAIVIEYFGNYAYAISGKSLTTLKTEWKADASELGMTMWAEHETLEEHYKKW